MKKYLIFIVIALLLGAGAAVWQRMGGYSTPQVKQAVLPAVLAPTPLESAVSVASYKDASYIIEGETVQLRNGHESEPAAPDSVATVDTDYFGNEAIGDLNGDGLPDVAFIVTQSGGGTGIFFYGVVALKTPTGYVGTNAVFLGDRIAPQVTEIRNGVAIFNYAERKDTDPMTEPPSVGASKRLTITGVTLHE